MTCFTGADVGIAMGAGSDVTKEAADIVLVGTEVEEREDREEEEAEEEKIRRGREEKKEKKRAWMQKKKDGRK